MPLKGVNVADDRLESKLARWHEAADRNWARVTLGLVRGANKTGPHSLSQIELELAWPGNGFQRAGPAEKYKQQFKPKAISRPKLLHNMRARTTHM